MLKNLKISILFLIIATPVFAFQNMENVEIKVKQVSDHVYMLQGAGGNIGVLTGKDGVFMIDDQFAPLSQKIKNAIATISEEPIRFLINTHHHGDHSGGNANFKESGTLIMAHENVRKRLKESDSTGKKLPVITFNDELNIHINNNDIMVAHVHNAHTDGDALIYFPQSNVLHTGDTFFNGMFPYIDLDSGGSIDGDIEAAQTGLNLINQNTKIIPGHGEIATYVDYQNYLEMLKGIRLNIQNAIDSGATEDEITKNEKLTSEYYSDDEASDFFINGEKIRTTVFKSLQQKTPE